jgi:heptosyltransferase III
MNPPQSRAKILVMRGGGIGDFILTLPSIGLLRDAFPDCRLDVLGYRRVLGLVEGRHYADAVRSIDWAPLAALFNPRAKPDPALAAYLREFDLIVSYVYDPDGLFRMSLQKIGITHLLEASPHPTGPEHAAHFLAAPLASLGIKIEKCHPRLFLPPDIALPLPDPGNWVAIHPGSGGTKKNWPVVYWEKLLGRLVGSGRCVLVCGGEADEDELASLRAHAGERVHFLTHEPLDVLGATLATCRLFVGHDSGLSHLAAAVGIPTTVLFGPTDANIWAPCGSRVISAPDGRLCDLEPGAVWERLADMLP